MLKCERCLRSIGLWMYKKESANQEKGSSESAGDASLLKDETSLKRKLSDDLLSNKASKAIKSSAVQQVGKSHKELNPIREHFNWCPWLTQLDQSMCVNVDADNNINKSNKLVNKTPCFVLYEIVSKRQRKLPASPKIEATKKSTSALSLTSDRQSIDEAQMSLNTSNLIDRAKSAHSVLINCASSLYNNLN